MDNGTEVKPNYTAAESLVGVDENYISQLMAEAEKLGSSFPLCSELLARGVYKFLLPLTSLLIDSAELQYR